MDQGLRKHYQAAATKSRRRHGAEHILRCGGETGNIAVCHIAARVAGEEAGPCVEIPAQRPRVGEGFNGGIPVPAAA